MEKITRNYLQIKSIDQLKVKNKPIGNFYIKEDKKKDSEKTKDEKSSEDDKKSDEDSKPAEDSKE